MVRIEGEIARLNAATRWCGPGGEPTIVDEQHTPADTGSNKEPADAGGAESTNVSEMASAESARESFDSSLAQTQATAYRWCCWAAGLFIATAIILATALMLSGESMRRSVQVTGPGFVLKFVTTNSRQDADSLAPMIRVYHDNVADPTKNLYRLFFVEGVKFQYPPSSLLVFDLLPASFTMAGGKVPPVMARLWMILSAAAVALTVLVSIGLLTLGLRLPGDPPSPARSWLGAWNGETRLQTACRLALLAALGLSFYPLAKGFELGQIQVFIGLFTALALLANGVQRQAVAGACLALCCVIKPQLGIVLLWGVVRGRWSFVAGFLSVLIPAELISVLRFGLDAHVEYLAVLKSIGSHGEVFWPNQSVNGLVSRLLENGHPFKWESNAFAPYHPVVHGATLVTSAIFVLAGLWRPRNTDPRVDLAHVVLAATLASPVAWEHHYGVAVPVFAVCLGGLIRHRPLGQATRVLSAASFLLMASAFLRPEIIFTNRWTGMAGSHLFFGALVLFVLLMALKARPSTLRQAALPG